MSDYNEGDLVEAVKGEDHRIGRVTVPGAHQRMQGYCLHRYEEDGWTLTVIERAKPVLPTEPGAYAYDGWSSVAVRNDIGQWRDDSGNPLTLRNQDAGKLTRLEPVAETVKKVLDALGDYLDGQLTGRTKKDIISALSAEFGVGEHE